MVILTSCTSNKNIQAIDTDKAIISLSKGKCLGNCPVYDLWIFNDGRVVYNGLENVDKKGMHETSISLEKLSQIEALINNSTAKEIGGSSRRDLPITILKFNNRKTVYLESKISGNLLKVNNIMFNILENI